MMHEGHQHPAAVQKGSSTFWVVWPTCCRFGQLPLKYKCECQELPTDHHKIHDTTPRTSVYQTTTLNSKKKRTGQIQAEHTTNADKNSSEVDTGEYHVYIYRRRGRGRDEASGGTFVQSIMTSANGMTIFMCPGRAP